MTTSPDQAAEFSDRLRALGADAIELPVISIQAPQDPAPLDQAIERLASYDWLIFTSVNGVRFFLDRLDALAARSTVIEGAASAPSARQRGEQSKICTLKWI